MTKSDFEVLVQKIGLESKRKIKYSDAVPATISPIPSLLSVMLNMLKFLRRVVSTLLNR